MKKKDDKNTPNYHRPDHLANERTFLAWIRTNLGLMAFGFVVEKFSLFTQQVAAFLGKSGLADVSKMHSKLEGYAYIFGISLVALGAILCLFSYVKFKKTEQQINQDTYTSMILLDTLLTLLVFFIGVFLIVYLVNSHSVIQNG